MITITLKTKVWARVRHWHERHGLSYVAYHRSQDPAYFPNAQGMPAVIKFEPADNRPVSLTEPLQRVWFKMIKVASNYSLLFSDYLRCWRNLTAWDRAFSNGTSREQGYADYILYENIGGEDMKMTPTIANGATINLLGDAVRRGGRLMYPFEVTDVHSRFSRPLSFCATNSTVSPAPLGRVEPFDTNGAYDVPVPLLGNLGHAWIDADWVEITGKADNFPYFRNTVGRTE